MRDSDRIVGMLGSKTYRAEKELEPVKEYLVLTRYDTRRVDTGEMLSAADVQEILAIPFLGVVPESQAVLEASNSGIPVTLDEESDAGSAYMDVVDRFLGEDLPHRFMQSAKKGFFSRLFRG